jgi:hypothetical protein
MTQAQIERDTASIFSLDVTVEARRVRIAFNPEGIDSETRLRRQNEHHP